MSGVQSPEASIAPNTEVNQVELTKSPEQTKNPQVNVPKEWIEKKNEGKSLPEGFKDEHCVFTKLFSNTLEAFRLTLKSPVGPSEMDKTNKSISEQTGE
jgi:hypothetical protein